MRLGILPHSSAILRSRRDPREPLGYGCAWLLIGSLPLALYLVLIKQLKGVVIRIMSYPMKRVQRNKPGCPNDAKSLLFSKWGMPYCAMQHITCQLFSLREFSSF